jgi:uncharacterized linocin/CFP29 family protein
MPTKDKITMKHNNTGRIGVTAITPSPAQVSPAWEFADLDVNKMRANATLPSNALDDFDTVVIETYNARIVGLRDLRDRGLIHGLAGLGSVISTYHEVSDLDDPEISMWGSIDAEQDRQLYNPVEVPIPIVFKEFQLNSRMMQAAIQNGEQIDVTHVAAATRSVVRGLENLVFNGDESVYGGKPIYGYLNHPMRNTAAGTSWGTPANIYPNVLQMLAGVDSDNAPPPYVLYVSPVQYREMLAFTDSTHTMNSLRLLLDNLPEIEAVEKASVIPDGQAVLVSMNRETCDLAVAEDIVLIPWESRGGMTHHWRVMAAMAPRVKSDYDGRSGVYHITGI